jgi:ATP-dependent DNA helicase RecG
VIWETPSYPVRQRVLAAHGAGGDGRRTCLRVPQWIAVGETHEVEFKGEQRERLNDRDLAEAVVCLANGAGGVLLVGVEDDGTVSGARPRHEAGRTDPLRAQALIANMTQPALSAVAGIVRVEGAEVLVVEVPDSPRVVGTTIGTYGRPTCVPYHVHEMLAHEVDRGAVDWAGLRIGGAIWADL